VPNVVTFLNISSFFVPLLSKKVDRPEGRVASARKRSRKHFISMLSPVDL
jgi:hypothetical protein